MYGGISASYASYLPKHCYIAHLQRVQNAAAWLILGLDRRSHIKPALQRLHWLVVHLRITYKIATLMYSVLHRRCPQYLLDLITFSDNDSGRRCLRSTTFHAAIAQRTRTQLATELFQYVAHSLEQFTQDWQLLIVPPAFKDTSFQPSC